jgi:hypothetical protein
MAKGSQLRQIAASDASVIGMVSDLHNYTLVHFVNKVLHFDLKRIGDLTVPALAEDKPGQYPLFHWFDLDNRTAFSMVENKSNGLPLMQSLRNIDYLLISTGLYKRYNLEGAMKILRSIDGVRLAQRIPFSPIGEFEALMQQLELHLYSEKPENKILWSLI